MKNKCLRGMGMGWGNFSPPYPLLLTFMVTKISYFCLIAKIECLHHELDNFDSTLGVALGLVELEASRTFGQVEELLHFEGG